MAGLVALLKSLGPARLGAMGAVAAILIGFFVFLMTRLSAVTMAPLYSELSLEDSAAVVAQLEASGTPYELRNGGATIMAPVDDVLRLRMQLAGEGLPTGGSMGYEIFDTSNTLGATSFVQNINHLRALEGELARSIRTLDRIRSARVHLVIPERQLFQRDAQQPTASIVLAVRGALEPGQIRAIQHLVASAVEGLKPESVSIVDESGLLLASGGDANGGVGTAALDERTAGFEKRLGDRVGEIVSSIVGAGRTRIQVAAEFDFNRVTETTDSFDPDGQVVRSLQTRTEESQSGAARSGAVSVGNGLPGAQEEAAAGPGGDSATVTEETTNYEIARTTKTEVIEGGRLKRLSVAVLVDGIYTPDGNGAFQYAPRPQEELDRIAALVRSAVGFDQARGDVIEVVNLRFATAPSFDALPTDENAGFLGLGKDDYFAIAEMAVTVILGLLVLFFVVRPLIRRIVTPDAPPAGSAAATGAMTLVLPDGRPGAAGVPALMAPEAQSDTALQIERAKQTGAIRADTIGRVGQLAKDNPADAVAIVRSWLAEPA